MKKLLKLAFSLSLLLSILAWMHGPAAALAPNEVIGYAELGFKGQTYSWKLMPDQRHKFVLTIPSPNENIRSIRIGKDVRVMIFEHPHFHNRNGVPINEIISGNNEFGKFWGPKSLLIFPASQKVPHGLYLRGTTLGDLKGPKSIFLAMPEEKSKIEICFPNLRFLVSKMLPASVYGKSMKASLSHKLNCVYQGWELGGPDGTAAEISEFKPNTWPLNQLKKSIYSARLSIHGPLVFKPLPQKLKNPEGPAPEDKGLRAKTRFTGKWKGSDGYTYEIALIGKDYSWRVVGILAPSAAITVKPNDFLIAVYDDSTSGGKKILSGKLMHILNDGTALRIEWNNGLVFQRTLSLAEQPKEGTLPGKVPADMIGIIDLGGKWQSSGGRVYQIKQNGFEFTWTVQNHPEKGSGSLSGQTVKASWGVSGGTIQHGEGIVSLVGKDNKALEIQWNNGIRFSR